MTRAKNTEQRKKEIVEGMLKTMSLKGYEKASISEIAKYAGVRPGIIHYHFSSKKAILFALLEYLKEQIIQKIENLPKKSIYEYVNVFLSTRNANPEHLSCWIAIGVEAIKDNEVKKAYSKTISQLVSYCQHLMPEINLEFQDVSVLIFATIQGYFFMSTTTENVIPPNSAANMVNYMVKNLLKSSKYDK